MMPLYNYPFINYNLGLKKFLVGMNFMFTNRVFQDSKNFERISIFYMKHVYHGKLYLT